MPCRISALSERITHGGSRTASCLGRFLRALPVSEPVHPQPSACKGRDASCLAGCGGGSGREALPIRSQGTLQIQERNHRTDLWFSQGTAWFPLYTAIWEGADGRKGCAYLRMPKSQKESKKAVENPPNSLVVSAHFGLLFPIFRHLRSKPAFGLNQKRVCLRSEGRGHQPRPYTIASPGREASLRQKPRGPPG